MKSVIAKLIEDESGATAVEYGLIAALLVVGMIVALNSVAAGTIAMWTGISDKTEEAMN